MVEIHSEQKWYLTLKDLIYFPCWTQITLQQIQEYDKDLNNFGEKFHAEGPGAVGADLDKGEVWNWLSWYFRNS